jgi:hypothetical protein
MALRGASSVAPGSVDTPQTRRKPRPAVPANAPVPPTQLHLPQRSTRAGQHSPSAAQLTLRLSLALA